MRLTLALLPLLTACGSLNPVQTANAEGPHPVNAQAPEFTAQQAANAASLGLPVPSMAPLVQRLSPSVVSVKVTKSASNTARFLGGYTPEMGGEGSGFILSTDGEILTNHHVIQGADKLVVVFADGRELPARVLGSDDRTDVALLKVDAQDLPALELGDSAGLQVGDWVVAIGNPFGLGHTVTTGIVSAKGRALGAGPYDDFLQTDAAINPGNSGGPLFDLNGRVVGMNTAIIQQANGIGFAIPIDMVEEELNALRTKGRVSRGWLGVATGEDDEGRVVIGEVYAGTPAGKAGLVPGDRLLALDGQPVTESAALVRAIGRYEAGARVELTVLRDGKEHKVPVTLAERPPERSLR